MCVLPGTSIKNNILDKLAKSPVISIICDETCDITVKEQLIMYIKCVSTDTWSPETTFIGIVEVSTIIAQL